MASEQVFHTTEICEEILRHLPIQDLLRARQACKRWEETIAASSRLQELLFLRPMKPTTIWLVDITNLPDSPQRIGYSHVDRMLVKAAVSPTSEDVKAHQGLNVLPIRPNPLFEANEESKSMQPLDTRVSLPQSLIAVEGFRATNFKPHGIWQDMFLTQPPVKRVTLEIRTPRPTRTKHVRDNRVRKRHRRACFDCHYQKLHIESGIKIKHVAEALKRRWEDTELDPSCVVWTHGVIVPGPGDEERMRARTNLWKEGLGVPEVKTGEMDSNLQL